MGVAHPLVLAVSLAIAMVLGAGGGLAYGALSNVSLGYGMATGLFLVGIVALTGALLGATEPPEGWSSRRRGAGRRSFAARLAEDVSVVDRVSGGGLVVWALVVGGGTLACSFLLFDLVA
ncbi:MAG TPA: hypothetical protein VM573_07095 [Actinomycetota bacterium]|jgi:hypothetical protein|nr:hypothetical protein [Actinomycetota bacterium]